MFSCARCPPNQPKTHRPRAWFPPHLPPLVRFSFSPAIPAMSINAVPTKPPRIDHDKSSNGFMRLPPGQAFAIRLLASNVRDRYDARHPSNDRCGLSTTGQCSDGIDNDGDNRIDWPDDRQCKSPEEDSERRPFQ